MEHVRAIPRRRNDHVSVIEALYRAESSGMVRLAYTLVGNNAEAEELVQDAFVEVHRRLDEISDPGAYLRTTTVMRCRHVLRRRRVMHAHRPEPPSVVTRKTLGQQGIDLVAPAPPASSPKGWFSKADFTIDLDAATINYPVVHTVTIPPRTDGKRSQVRFPTSIRAACSLHDRCTKRVKGRVIEINADEEILAAARAARSTPQFRRHYRERARAERKVARIKARQSKIPWRGLTNAITWVELRAGALNLDRIGRLGLIT